MYFFEREREHLDLRMKMTTSKDTLAAGSGSSVAVSGRLVQPVVELCMGQGLAHPTPPKSKLIFFYMEITKTLHVIKEKYKMAHPLHNSSVTLPSLMFFERTYFQLQLPSSAILFSLPILLLSLYVPVFFHFEFGSQFFCLLLIFELIGGLLFYVYILVDLLFHRHRRCFEHPSISFLI